MPVTYTETAIESALSAISWNADGLVPAIAQEAATGEILMMAWMNADAVRETLATGRVCYWSRSRKSLWRKGESSGQRQRLSGFMVDCDGDTVLLKVHQEGVACHTGRRNCFFNQLEEGGLTINQPVVVAPEALYPEKDRI